MVGALEGVSDGAPSGPAVAQLQPTGTLVFQFAPDGETNADGEQQIYGGQVTVDQAGTLADPSGQVRLLGSFDLDSCEGAGDWSAGSLTGTWVLHLP